MGTRKRQDNEDEDGKEVGGADDNEVHPKKQSRRKGKGPWQRKTVKEMNPAQLVIL